MSGNIRKAFVDDHLAYLVWVSKQPYAKWLSDEYFAQKDEWEAMTPEQKRALVSEEETREMGRRNL